MKIYFKNREQTEACVLVTACESARLLFLHGVEEAMVSAREVIPG